MKSWTRIGVFVLAGAMFAGFLNHRLRSNGNTQRSLSDTNAQAFADIPWVRRQPHAPAPAKPGKVDSSASIAEPKWSAEFASSADLFAFTKKAAVPAFHGDGTAALYVARALEICQLQVVLYGHASDPQGAFEAWLSEQQYMPEAEAAKSRHNFDLCRGFFGGNAFASLPPKKGNYEAFSYWLNAASSDGNPVAEVIHVGNELPAVGNGQNHRDAQAVLISAVSTGDPEAVFRTGYFLLNGHGGNSIDAYALTIAGCDLGYNCSANNSFIFGDCARLGICSPGLTFQDKIAQQIGPGGYAKAYELAQQLEAAIADGDTTAISKVVYLSK
ncbi:MAG: hypothetical protein KGO22_10055 [Gammaproteobacteria bacterium]|nr:hypothetical protein [Gammaproteobacteria bacterium]